MELLNKLTSPIFEMKSDFMIDNTNINSVYSLH